MTTESNGFDGAAAPVAPPMLVRSAAVLGSGTMGSRIAAHLANCGIPVLLLDLVPEGETKARSRLAVTAIEGLLKSKPAAFYESAAARLVTPGNFEDDLARLAGCDWVIEAVTEDLGVKRALLTRVLPHIGAEAILTTNTSGLPIAQITASLGEGFTASARKRWFGTHFFNPPRYMRLLEVIPTAETDAVVVAGFADFADRILGKEVVLAPRAQVPVAGLAALPLLETGVYMMGEAGFASEHDQLVARKAAYILCGGRLTPGSFVPEQYFLDLEREAFLSLCGERKTQERIAFTLKTGKPLRN